ncbi:hypothetical protein Dimus_009463 [Dionaea muscipula]
MLPHGSRKLLPPEDEPAVLFTTQNAPVHANSPVQSLSPNDSSATSSSSSTGSASFDKRQHPYDTSSSSSSSSSFNNYKLNSPFDSSMALTVLVLLTALFFMGFFSVYIRRFSDDSSVELYRRSRRRRGSSTPPDLSTSPYVRTTGATAAAAALGGGVDPAVVSSLPVYTYDVGAKKGIAAEGVGEGSLDCPICLSEFEERETEQFFPRPVTAAPVDAPAEERGSAVVEVQGEDDVEMAGPGVLMMMRCGSCPRGWLGESESRRVLMLQRSFSF